MLAQLIPIEGGDPIELKRDITLVGRKAGVCDLVLKRGSISKMHCLIVKTDGLLFIRDLGSTNGTKVNGQKVTRGALLPGDELAFASAKFRVHLGPALKADLEQDAHTEMLQPLPDPPTLQGVHRGNGSHPGAGPAPPPAEPSDSESDVRLLPDESAV